jgi:hypothetical protein
MITRRFMIVPPAMPNGGRFGTLDREQKNIRACNLKRRT